MCVGTVLAGLRWWAGDVPASRSHPAPASARFEVRYADEVTADVHLRLDAEAWAALERKPRRFTTGELEYAGVTYPARVRLKGHRSLRKLGQKAAFKLELAAAEGSAHRPSLTLNNMVEDPTLLREAVAYRFMRELGLPAPRTAYARVQVNGAPYGLYLIVETIDEAFLLRHFGPGLGALYEGEYGCDITAADVAGMDLDAGQDPQRAYLSAFAEAASGDARALFHPTAGPLELRTFLRYLAASALVGDFDGYRHAHNYYVYYHLQDRKWRFLPWGLDRTFRKPLAIYDSQGWLARRCFQEPACRLEYARTLATAADRFEGLQLEQFARQMAARIDAAAASDPLHPDGEPEIARARERLFAFLRERAAGVRRQLACLDEHGVERDRDGDGYGCSDCNDADPAVHPGAAELCDQIDNDCSGLVDDAPACGCEPAVVGGREFQLCHLPMPWSDAQRFCEQKGLALARIESVRQSKALYRKARRIDRQRWWIGYSDREQEGDFRWQDGRAGSFTYWSRKQPDNGTCNEDCVALEEGAGGKWQDTHCNQHRPFICGPRPAPSTRPPAAAPALPDG